MDDFARSHCPFAEVAHSLDLEGRLVQLGMERR